MPRPSGIKPIAGRPADPERRLQPGVLSRGREKGLEVVAPLGRCGLVRLDAGMNGFGREFHIVQI